MSIGVRRVAVALGNRRERPAARTLLAPGRRDHTQSLDTLDRAHYIDSAEDRPPARSRMLEEAEAREPLPAAERRHVAAKAPAVQLEPEQVQPVLQAQQPDESRVPRRARCAAAPLPGQRVPHSPR